VARAKRTDRAEARRKYRAYLQAEAEAQTAEGVEPEAPAAAPTAGRWRFPGAPAATSSTESSAPSSSRPARDLKSRPASGATGTAPMGFIRAMRVAYHPINYRDDLRYLPTLLTRTHAFWPAAALIIAGLAIAIVDTDPNDFWIGLAGLVLPPYPLIPAMIAGVLAPRAAWLAGLMSGLVAGLSMWVIIAVAASRFPVLREQASSQLLGIAIEWMLVALCFGALVGALSAWYRRFLSLVMVPRPPRASSRPGKPPVRKSQTARR
jgi:hypothetical protein